MTLRRMTRLDRARHAFRGAGPAAKAKVKSGYDRARTKPAQNLNTGLKMGKKPKPQSYQPTGNLDEDLIGVTQDIENKARKYNAYMYGGAAGAYLGGAGGTTKARRDAKKQFGKKAPPVWKVTDLGSKAAKPEPRWPLMRQAGIGTAVGAGTLAPMAYSAEMKDQKKKAAVRARRQQRMAKSSTTSAFGVDHR